MKLFKVAQHSEIIFLELEENIFYMRRTFGVRSRSSSKDFIETHFKELEYSDKKVLKYLEKETVTPEEAIEFLNWGAESVIHLFCIAFEAINRGGTGIEVSVSHQIF
jgi:hypothetical protein